MITRDTHLQPLCLFHFFVSCLDELLVGGDQFLQMFRLTDVEPLIFLSLKVVFAARRTFGHLTDRQTSDDQTSADPQWGQDVL